jgi:murein DD-endopeptidase MepM/ murein hydrolase activator NlpD
MHKGVDFGAPTGTPIFAAGNGTIEDIGFRNGYGRYIKIRHNGQLATAYAHMSRFNASLFRGAHVAQGEVIGYVGMSGRATGPHLHFEVHVNGRQVNPMSVNLPTGRVLDGKLLALFKQGKSTINNEFAKLLTERATGPLVRASTTTKAFTTQTASSCGSNGGC